MKKAICIVTLGVIAIIASCDYKKGALPPKEVPLAANACDSIRYTNGVKSIIDNACISCHSGPFGSGGVDLTTYANAKIKALDGRIKDRITNANNPMPPFGLMSQVKVDSIKCWIDKGAPQ